MARKIERKKISKYEVFREAAADLLRKKYGARGSPKIRLEYEKFGPMFNYKLHKWKNFPYMTSNNRYREGSLERYNPELLVADEPSQNREFEKKAYEPKLLEVKSPSWEPLIKPMEIHEEAEQNERNIEGEKEFPKAEIGEPSSQEDSFDFEKLMEEVESMFENEFKTEVEGNDCMSEKCEVSSTLDLDLLDDVETSEQAVEVEDRRDEEK